MNLSVYASFDLPKTDGETHMSLSIAWSCPDQNGSQSIAFSDSRGYISVVDLNNLLVKSFKAHNFEAWIVTFKYAEPNLLYTGNLIFLFIKALKIFQIQFLIIYKTIKI